MDEAGSKFINHNFFMKLNMKFFLIIAILVTILFGPDVYVFGLIKNGVLGGKSWLYFIPEIIVFILIFCFSFENDHTAKFRHIGYSVFVLLCLQLPKFIFTVVSLLGKLLSLIHVPTMPLTIAGIVLGGVVLCTLLYGCFIELYNFNVRHVEYKSADIPPAFDGYTLVHLSDIHSGSWNPNGKQMKKAVQLINEQNADAIVFTGDLVTNNHTEIDPFFEYFSNLKAKDGIFSVLGNHDYSFIMSSRDTLQKLIQKEKSLGWHLLLNENHKIVRGTDSIAIIGVENVGKKPFPHVGNLTKASEGTDGMFRILLSHDPTHWREEILSKSNIPLTLSGHTHAGQLDLPFLSLSRSMYPEYRGLYSQGNQSIYINPGLGFTFIPVRIGARPEITVIKLVMSNE